MRACAHGRLLVVAAPVIQTLFLRDTRHGGAVDQAQTVARKLAAFLRQATATIDVAIYDFRLSDALAGPIVEVLSKAAARGVSVRIAYDAGKPAAATRATFAMLAADPAPSGTAQWVANHFGNTDVQIRAMTAPSGQLMHSKYVVRDGGPAAGAIGAAAVWTGSANFTDDAWTLQENNIITVASAEVAAGYRRDFDELWASGSIKKTGAARPALPQPAARRSGGTLRPAMAAASMPRSPRRSPRPATGSSSRRWSSPHTPCCPG